VDGSLLTRETALGAFFDAVSFDIRRRSDRAALWGGGVRARTHVRDRNAERSAIHRAHPVHERVHWA
jgi:hypothetical protein